MRLQRRRCSDRRAGRRSAVQVRRRLRLRLRRRSAGLRLRLMRP